MRKPFYLYGAGGLGKEYFHYIFQTFDFERLYHFAGFIDDSSSGAGFRGYQIYHAESFQCSESCSVLFSVGSPQVKFSIDMLLAEKKIEFPTLVHPKAEILDLQGVVFGDGSVICPGAVLTTDISIGRHVLINLNCTVGHDSRVGDYSSLMPGVHVSGQVTIGREVMVGTGAMILNGVKIGDGAVIGAGAVVNRDVPAGVTVAGVPARPLRQ